MSFYLCYIFIFPAEQSLGRKHSCNVAEHMVMAVARVLWSERWRTDRTVILSVRSVRSFLFYPALRVFSLPFVLSMVYDLVCVWFDLDVNL